MMDQRYTYLFSFFRIVLGAYLVIHFIELIPYTEEIWGATGTIGNPSLNLTHGVFPNVLYIINDPIGLQVFMILLAVLSLLLTVGFKRNWVALLIWYGWVCLFDRNNLIAALSRDTCALCFHLRVHRAAHVLEELDLFDAEVDEFDAQVARGRRGCREQVAHQLGTLERDRLGHRALAELGHDRVLDDLAETPLRDEQRTAGRRVEANRVDDAVLDEEVHIERFVLGREHALRTIADR